MDQIRIGIIGGGKRASELLPLFSRPRDGVEVVAVDDTNWEALFEKFGAIATRINYYGNDDRRMLEDPTINTIVITTPDWLHEEHAYAALEAGKHVYLEKPMALTPEGCDRILQTAKRSQRTLYVGHNLRHFTVIKKLKELIDSGVVGEVKAIWCKQPISYGKALYFKPGRWQGRRQNVGSLLIHKGCHDIDIIHWLGGGHSVRVSAMGTRAVFDNQEPDPGVEDLSSMLMLLDNGVQATYQQCHFAFRATREYEIHGTKGTLLCTGDQPESALIQLYSKRGKGLLGEITEQWRFEKEEGYHGRADLYITEEFINTIRGTAKPTTSPEDAAWSVKAGWAATLSLRNGNKPIDIT